MGMFISVKTSRAGREGTGDSYIFSRSLVTDFYSVLDEAVQLAVDETRAEKLNQTFKGDVIFTPRTGATLLQYLLVPAFSARNVLEGYSPLKDKIGEKVLGKVTLIDDGTLVGGMSTSLYDAEGVPRRRTVLVENGILKSYLHNTYTAKRMGAKSTGNAARRRGEITVSRSNLLLKPGEHGFDELVEQSKLVLKGFLLSVHTVNYVTGNFSVVASKPYLVKEGELLPVKPVTVAGNIYEIAETIRLSRRVKQDFPGIVIPDMLFGSTTVSG